MNAVRGVDVARDACGGVQTVHRYKAVDFALCLCFHTTDSRTEVGVNVSRVIHAGVNDFGVKGG